MVKEITDKETKAVISSKVLADLPEWFGIEAYTKDYIEKSKAMPFFAKSIENEFVGFIALKETSVSTVEIYCMGLIKQHHRSGFGKELYVEAEQFAKQKGYRCMQVKTVEQGKYEVYDATHAFYTSLGFYELEAFPTLWDAWNPCQVLIKPI